MSEIVVLNERQVAEMIGMTVAWLQMCRFKGVGIPYYKIGRCVKYNKNSVIEWLQSRQVSPEDDLKNQKRRS